MKKLLLILFLLPSTIFGQTHNVTFKLDMNPFAGTFTAVEVFGTFNNFQGGVTVMTDADMDGIYDITVPITADSIEFVYALDTNTFNYIVEDFGVNNGFPNPPPCTKRVAQFTNRFILLTTDTTLPAYCWESCVECGGTPLTADVTFQVDMSEYSGPSYSQVNLNGTFNNFCGTCAVMTDANSDMIYELTVNLPTMDTAEYIFTLDGFSTGQESFPIGPICTITTIEPTDTFTNRYVVPFADTTLPAVCWESCTPCGANGLGNLDDNSNLKIYPNPSKGVFNISGDIEFNEALTIRVLDVRGKEILSLNAKAETFNNRLDLSGYENGVYFIQVISGSKTFSESLVLTK